MEPKIDTQGWQKQWRDAYAAAQARFSEARTLDELEQARVQFLGRAGRLNELFKSVGSFTPEQKRELLAPANEDKARLLSLLDGRKAAFERQALDAELGRSPIDPTLPAPPVARGRLHPLTQTLDEMCSILGRLGFSWAEGPLIEGEYFNFEALN
ncbi:MAG: phenylalanine--tRNA ligase subunit alpha, partial [Elusimicrobia bacterium]|nr:phenylalanine--tRNA ligase subunit alpha [Elusimicrobiota bacterium]